MDAGCPRSPGEGSSAGAGAAAAAAAPESSGADCLMEYESDDNEFADSFYGGSQVGANGDEDDGNESIFGGGGGVTREVFAGSEWFIGKGSMAEQRKYATSMGHTFLTARDLSASNGTKAWGSYASGDAFFEHLMRLDYRNRHFYEIVTGPNPVRFWLDIEFCAGAEEGEGIRAGLHNMLSEFLYHTFFRDVAAGRPIMIWGTSSRWDRGKNAYKHSYQLRVPNLIFPCNHTKGLLAQVVKGLARALLSKGLFRDPAKVSTSMLDTGVYTTNRSVRTPFSTKKADSTFTCLRLMRDVGDGVLVKNDEASEFHVFMVQPTEFEWNAGVLPGLVRVAVENLIIRVPSLDIEEAVTAPDLAGRRGSGFCPGCGVGIRAVVSADIDDGESVVGAVGDAGEGCGGGMGGNGGVSGVGGVGGVSGVGGVGGVGGGVAGDDGGGGNGDARKRGRGVTRAGGAERGRARKRGRGGSRGASGGRRGGDGGNGGNGGDDEGVALDANGEPFDVNESGPAQPPLRGGRSNDVRQGENFDHVGEVIECLSLLGCKHVDAYEDWQGILFAVKNRCGMNEEVISAFVEWSRKGHSFPGEASVRNAYSNTARRDGSDGLPYRGVKSLRLAAQADPVIVFKEACCAFDEQVQDGAPLTFSSFVDRVDAARTDWRAFVRVCSLLWEDEFESTHWFVTTEFYEKQKMEDDLADLGSRVQSLWNQPRTAGPRFIGFTEEFIRRRIAWPHFVVDVLPEMLAREHKCEVVITHFHWDRQDALEVHYETRLNGSSTPALHSMKFDVRKGVGNRGIQSISYKPFFIGGGGNDASKRAPAYGPAQSVQWVQFLLENSSIRNVVLVGDDDTLFLYNEHDRLWRFFDSTNRKHFLPILTRFFQSAMRKYVQLAELRMFADWGTEAFLKELRAIDAMFGDMSFQARVLDVLMTVQDMTVEAANTFNVHKALIPCKNGVLDIRTRKLREYLKEDYFTYKLPCEWDPSADTTFARDFVRSLFPYHTDDYERYIFRWFGYCISGYTYMQMLVFFIGYGRNGKSELTGVMEKLLGKVGYARVSYDSLCARSSAPNEEMYAARLSRMWQVDENDGDRKMNFAQLKSITGEDSFRVRQLYGHQVVVKPLAKLNFCVNKPPRMDPSDRFLERVSLARRLSFIECPMQFLELRPQFRNDRELEQLKEEMGAEKFAKCTSQINPDIRRQLEQHLNGFFRLCIEAFSPFVEPKADGTERMDKIPVPECMQVLLDQMMRSNEGVKAHSFLSERYDYGVEGVVPVGSMYREYLRYSSLSEQAFTQQRFCRDLESWIQENRSRNGAVPVSIQGTGKRKRVVGIEARVGVVDSGGGGGDGGGSV